MYGKLFKNISLIAAGMLMSLNALAAGADKSIDEEELLNEAKPTVTKNSTVKTTTDPDLPLEVREGRGVLTPDAFDNFLDDETVLGGEFSTWVEFASDYMFRGTSETKGGKIPSLKGAITWAHPSGLYVGAYMANNLFPQPVSASNPTGDIQRINAIYGPYIGFAKNDLFGTGINYNGQFFQYIYPGGNQFNYMEMFNYIDKQFGIFNVKLEYSPTITDWFGVKDLQSHNVAFIPSVNLPHKIKLTGAYGHNYFSTPNRSDYNGDGSEDLGWSYWSLTLSRKVFGFNVDLSYHDTDVKTGQHDLYGRPDQRSSINSRYVFAISKTF